MRDASRASRWGVRLEGTLPTTPPCRKGPKVLERGLSVTKPYRRPPNDCHRVRHCRAIRQTQRTYGTGPATKFVWISRNRVSDDTAGASSAGVLAEPKSRPPRTLISEPISFTPPDANVPKEPAWHFELAALRVAHISILGTLRKQAGPDVESACHCPYAL